MKRTIYILCAVVAVVIGALIGAAVWLADALEAEKNRNRTAAARDKRWPAGATEEEIDEDLEELQQLQQEMIDLKKQLKQQSTYTPAPGESKPGETVKPKTP